MADRTATSPDPIVEFIAAQPGLARRLLDQHRDDGRGRCRLCTPGAQAAHVRWPCRIHWYAELAHSASPVRPSGTL